MKPPLPKLHAITDERVARRPDLDQVARELAVPGLAVHARGRGLSGLEHSDLAARLSHVPAALFVNDRLDVALMVAALGVQLGQGGLPVSAARALGPRWWIGKSVHTLAEAEAAKAEGADYLLVGPVFATPTHAGRAPLGLDGLREVARLGVAVIAIGGIGPGRAREVREAGAHGAAAIRALWDAAEPAAAARRMLEELQ